MWLQLVLAAGAVLVAPGGIRVRRRLRGAVAVAPGGPADGPVADASDPQAVAGTFDLLAACLEAGLPPSTAAAAVAPSAPPPLSESLRRTADLLALGADPATAWAATDTDPATEALARMARRSARSGAALSGGIAELAAGQRADAEDRAVAAAERAGVLISGPLGLCFLPAFICLGIVPVVIGLAGGVLAGGLL
ncbi:type II secretion system F family protein [Prescottella subtropica]|uniref:type II secretion system F family protein n=1 Tax=Prescottella subtropica TaxID=2545757 RepID=UPI0010F8E298|nr:type II secretion system F family protein [Prescottella subtropica]